jgi:hypothetical protein
LPRAFDEETMTAVSFIILREDAVYQASDKIVPSRNASTPLQCRKPENKKNSGFCGAICRRISDPLRLVWKKVRSSIFIGVSNP